jgi:ribosomal protein L37AE/L43A
MTDKAVGAAGSPTSATAFSSMHDSPPHVAVEPSDVSVAAAAAAQQQAQKTGSRKRVFTFQKRWLHSLPIVERSLPEAEMDGRVLKAVRTAGRASAAAAVTAAAAAGADKHKDVIVCMLCDDPASKRELTKVWSRLNCRRGRIENHLTSKHPEFMRLLKNKREVEGDLAVQIFLQNMREGRCNARTEINNGLYSQLQTVGGVMRAGAVDGAPPEDHAELQKRALSDYINVRGDTDSNRKRPKLEGSPANGKDVSMASVYSAGGMKALR